MSTITDVIVFQLEEVLDHDDLNTNFAKFVDAFNLFAVLTDTPRTMSAALTFAVAPLFPVAVAFGAKVTVTAGGLEVTGAAAFNNAASIAGALQVGGNAAIVGTLGVNGVGGLSVVGPIGSGGAATFAGGGTFGGAVTAASFSGAGSGLTGLNAANLSGVLPALDGHQVTLLNASAVAAGTLGATFLPTVMGDREFTHVLVKNGGARGLDFDTSYLAFPAGGAVPSLAGQGPVALGSLVWFKVNTVGTSAQYYIAGYTA